MDDEEKIKLLADYATRVLAHSGKWYIGEQGIDQATADQVSQERADLIEKLKAQLEKLAWISVDHHYPFEEGYYLTFNVDSEWEVLWWGSMSESKWSWVVSKVSHWQILTRPDEGKEEVQNGRTDDAGSV